MSAAVAAIPPVLIVESTNAVNVRSSGYTLLNLFKTYLKTKDVGTQFQLKVSIKSEYIMFCDAWSAYNAEVAHDPSKKSSSVRNWFRRYDDDLDPIRDLVWYY